MEGEEDRKEDCGWAPYSRLGVCNRLCQEQRVLFIHPSPELVFSLKPWLGLFPANSMKSACVPGELLFKIFLEFRAVMLGSQYHLRKTNKQAVVGFISV